MHNDNVGGRERAHPQTLSVQVLKMIFLILYAMQFQQLFNLMERTENVL